MQAVLDNKDEINETLKSYGFDYITLDLNGYIQGNMNKAIGK